MHHFPLLLAAAVMAILSGCGKPPEPVDPVPPVEDVNNIVVNGKPMTKTEFIDEYCLTFERQANHPVCVRVLHAYRIEFLRSPNGPRRF